MNKANKRLSSAACAVILAMTISAANAADIGTAFTFQGTLENGSGAVTGDYDFRFRLYDALTGGGQVGPSRVHDGNFNPVVTVENGLFKVVLDFGQVFGEKALWLEIDMRPDNVGSYTTLIPRLELTPAPHALALPGFYTTQNAVSPNIIGGHHDNAILGSVVGATISGGGWLSGGEQLITDDFSTIGGGESNQAGNNDGDPTNARYATVGGGWFNIATGFMSCIGCGESNQASADRATVSGGSNNLASGEFSTVPGGAFNIAGGDYSFASGRRAHVRDAATTGDADGDEGTFVWADSTEADFTSTGPNQFLIRAAGGVGIGTSTPGMQLDVAGGIWSTSANGGFLSAFNPNNQNASVVLGWLNDVARIRIGGNGAGSAGGFDFQRGGDVSLMRLLNNGNVGIGTPSPTAKLHVGGTAGVDGIMFPDGTLQTSAVQVLRVSHVQDLGSIAAGGLGTVTATVPGAVVGNVAYCSPSSLDSGLAIAMVRVSAADTVQVRVQNVSVSAINPPSITWEIAVIP